MYYRKIPKISPGLISLKALFEELIFEGAYIQSRLHLRREICVSKSIGLALWLEGNLPFLLFFTKYIWRGGLTEGFLHYEFGGLIFLRYLF